MKHLRTSSRLAEKVLTGININTGSTTGNHNHASGNGIDTGTITSSNCDGPRVLVVGPADCGKTSLVKVLTSYGE